MKRRLLHRALLVRSLSLFTLTTALFLITWTLAYFLLPEGLLRGRTGAQVLAGDQAAPSFLAEWLRIAAINLTLGAVGVVGANLIRAGRYPMGYMIPAVWAVMYAITLGTNSFAFPLPDGKMPPTWAVLGRSGPYEIIAYILAAAATYHLPRYTLQGRWPRQQLVSIPLGERLVATNEQWLGLGGAVVILLLANAWEAYQIVTLFG